MPAQLVQRNKQRFKKVKVDTVTIDIIESALRNARFEMDTVLFRTAMSPGIREQHDEFPMIANLEGKMVVGQFGSFIWGFLQGYQGTIEEGDIFLTNDPYSVRGAISHANDWLMLMPIYRKGRLIAWSAMFGHMTDVGGKVPGSLPTDARTIFEEGIRVPPVKIYKRGILNQDVLDIMLHNCRLPHWNRSDFNAIVAALRTAAARCIEVSERFGDDVFQSAMSQMLARNRHAMRELIRRTVPEKKQYFEDYICDDGLNMGPYKIACSMWREGDKCIFDFAGTDPQSISSINFLLNEEMFKMFAGVYMIMVFDPQILFNDGFYDLMEVRIPPGTLLKPVKPAALSCRTHALGRIFDVLGGLLGQGNPQFLCAAGFSDSPHFMYSGHDKNGDWYQLYQISFGGIPGKPFGDGPDGHSLWPSFTNVPNEFLESYFPLRIETYETIADSGGAGKHRGGNGLRIGYRFLEDGEISIHDDRWLTYPWGVNGGLPGARSRKTLLRKEGSQELLPSKIDRVKVRNGDLLVAETWGGGGCGDPLERDLGEGRLRCGRRARNPRGREALWRRPRLERQAGSPRHAGAAPGDGGRPRTNSAIRPRLQVDRRAQVAMLERDGSSAAAAADLQHVDIEVRGRHFRLMRAAQRAYATVRDGILRGEYRAGSRLTEQELAQAAGVSRTPVREALRRLHAEGLVNFEPNHGAVVAMFELEDAEEIFELRALLEPISARRAAERATPRNGRGAACLGAKAEAGIDAPNRRALDPYRRSERSVSPPDPNDRSEPEARQDLGRTHRGAAHPQHVRPILFKRTATQRRAAPRAGPSHRGARSDVGAERHARAHTCRAQYVSARPPARLAHRATLCSNRRSRLPSVPFRFETGALRIPGKYPLDDLMAPLSPVANAVLAIEDLRYRAAAVKTHADLGKQLDQRPIDHLEQDRV